MLIVSASLKKSGSGWYFNMTNDLLIEAGQADVRALCRRHGLEHVLQEDNCRINPHALNLARLLPLVLRGPSFVVKTHAGPTPSLRLLMAAGLARVTYLYRDPRDVVVSALEHGQRLRAAGQPNVLAELHTVADAVAYVRRLLAEGRAWTQAPHTLVVRYEDLVADPLGALRQLAAFLRLEVTEETLGQVAARYRTAQAAPATQQRLHFNKGVTGRFREELTDQERALCEHAFGPFLAEMGYPPVDR